MEEAKRRYSSVSDIRTVVTPDLWKLSLKQAGDHELYNLNEDPYEMKNLYFIGEYKDKIKELKGLILDWQKETGDNAVLPADE